MTFFINLHLCFQNFQFRIFFAGVRGRPRPACVVGLSGRWFMVWYDTVYIYLYVCVFLHFPAIDEGMIHQIC